MKKGFTLIELLIVIAIIGVLSSIVIASLNKARVSAKDIKRIQNIKSIKLAMELYYIDLGTYPPAACGADCGADITTLTGPLAPYIQLPSIVEGTSQSSSDSYATGPVPINSYGIHVYIEKTNSYCKTGVNVNAGWWGYGIPMCNF